MVSGQGRAVPGHEHWLAERVAGGCEVNLDLVAALHWPATLIAAQRD